MAKKETKVQIAEKLANEVISNGKSKRMKVRTLIGHFDYEKRTEDCATTITELLAVKNILLNPSIMKLGESWPLKLDDRVYLIERTNENREEVKNEINNTDIYDFKSDNWFDIIQEKTYRTEKEVENKFILPLLNRLGFSDDDRYDGMIINTCHGSKQTSLEVDFALFNNDNENLDGQTCLVLK